MDCMPSCMKLNLEERRFNLSCLREVDPDEVCPDTDRIQITGLFSGIHNKPDNGNYNASYGTYDLLITETGKAADPDSIRCQRAN
jgi:hypothetical protein